jgi:hypothetical protein
MNGRNWEFIASLTYLIPSPLILQFYKLDQVRVRNEEAEDGI